MIRREMMRRVQTLLLAAAAVLVPGVAAPQGLIAYPFLVCPDVGANRRCVWVTDVLGGVAGSREDLLGFFVVDAFNPGAGVAQVRVQRYDQTGVFQEVVFDGSIASGHTRVLAGFEAGVEGAGILIITSNVPLLLWAFKLDRHAARGARVEQPPRAAARQHVPVIPVDCSLQPPDGFAFVCGAAGGPPPPN